MNKIFHFKPEPDRTCEMNINKFIAYCRDQLNIYENEGGWLVNRWHNYSRTGKSIPITFSKYSTESQSEHIVFEPMDEPFLSFAKAYIRYDQSNKIVFNMGSRMCALRTLHDALVDIHGHADILKTTGLVISKSVELISLRYKSEDGKHKIGLALKSLLNFITDNRFVAYLPEWTPHWKKVNAKANRTDPDSIRWQEERCPSMHQMLTIADCFANANTPEDKYWSSVLVFLMFAPGRASELADLTIDCLHRAENGALGVRWYGAKGFENTIKWVPKPLETTVLEAHDRLVKLSEPARNAAKFAFNNPGIFLRHEECITSKEFSEDEPLNAYEVGKAMGFGEKTLNTISLFNDLNCKSAWKILASSGKWINNNSDDLVWTYNKLAKYTFNKFSGNKWPNMQSVNQPIWNSLTLTRYREFLSRNKMVLFSWYQPTVGDLNSQISSIRRKKFPIKTIFQRMGYKDEDGSELNFTTHQLRVWLSTNAERQGMDAWQLAQWAGRSRIKDNEHYDLRTSKEREDNHRSILNIEKRPTAIQAIKLNLPVSYQDLGINRIGIADITEYGMCIHDYAMAPCTKGGECMICKEHICIKGMPKTLERIKQLESLVESQFNKAKLDTDNASFGADRWVSHLGWKLSHIRTQRLRLESNDTTEGDILWINPENDPSSIERALKQRGNIPHINADCFLDINEQRGLLDNNDSVYNIDQK